MATSLRAQKDMEATLGKTLVFTARFQSTGDDFSALHAAREWLDQHGISYGSLQGSAPVALARNAFISKWRNLRDQDLKSIEGVMVSEGFRSCDVYVWLSFNPVDLFDLEIARLNTLVADESINPMVREGIANDLAALTMLRESNLSVDELWLH